MSGGGCVPRPRSPPRLSVPVATPREWAGGVARCMARGRADRGRVPTEPKSRGLQMENKLTKIFENLFY